MLKDTRAIRKKGFTVKEFLAVINRKQTWWNTHKHGSGKDHAMLMLAVNGLNDKEAENEKGLV